MTSLLERLVTSGDQAGLNIYYSLSKPEKRKNACTENAGRALFVSADGVVSPCIFMNIPAEGIHRITGDHEMPYERLHFGSLGRQSLPAIWQSQNYRLFRDSFDATGFTSCRECPKRYES